MRSWALTSNNQQKVRERGGVRPLTRWLALHARGPWRRWRGQQRLVCIGFGPLTHRLVPRARGSGGRWGVDQSRLTSGSGFDALASAARLCPRAKMGGGGQRRLLRSRCSSCARRCLRGVAVVRWRGMGGNVGAFAAAWWYWGVVGASLAARQRGRRWVGDSVLASLSLRRDRADEVSVQ
jgi:hypothetical protein